jgi:hypothetical protein
VKTAEVADADHCGLDFAHALLCPRFPAGRRDSSGATVKLLNWFVRARDYYLSQPRLKFEAMTLGLAVLFGLVVVPALIYLVGFYILKPYVNGSLFALYFDFFKGLIELRPSCWTVILGPFVFLSLYRISRLVLRKV